MVKAKRKVLDCKNFANENGCTIRISGKERQVLKVAVKHLINEHGHKDTPELKKNLRLLLKDEK